MTSKYQKQTFQEKIRSYLDVLREELNEIEARLDHAETNISLDEPEAVVEDAGNIEKRAQGLQADIEETTPNNWTSIRTNLQSAYDDLLENISVLEDRIEGMEPRRDIPQEHE